MIENWQVWLVDLGKTVGNEQAGLRPVVVVSSEHAIRMTTGRLVTAAPLTNTDRRWPHHVRVAGSDGTATFVMTEQIRTVSTLRFAYSEPWWTLSDDEVRRVRRTLRTMVDF